MMSCGWLRSTSADLAGFVMAPPLRPARALADPSKDLQFAKQKLPGNLTLASISIDALPTQSRSEAMVRI
jgi:hypothetical protein